MAANTTPSETREPDRSTSDAATCSAASPTNTTPPPESEPPTSTRQQLTQVRRYEAGTAQPNLEALRNLATALNVSLDELVFGDTQRGPDEDLALAFEATRYLDPTEQATVKEVIEALLLKHEARRWTNAS